MQTRRQFLSTAVSGPLLLALAPSVPGLLLRSAADTPKSADHDRVLVVIQLSGGNDGLNTIVPFADDVYARNRPTLRLPTSSLHKLSPQLGLHPKMGALARVFYEGRLSIIQGVGCPGLSRDHERALRFWQTAAPDTDVVDTGWLGRATDDIWRQTRPSAPGVFVGDIARPLGINAAAAVVPTLRRPRDAILEGAFAEAASLPSATSPSILLGHVQTTWATLQAQAGRLDRVLASSNASGAYPDSSLANDLQTVARLIRADLGIRIFFTELGGGGIGGFDNHANQMGNHCALLQQLSEALAAFTADLAADRLLDRVLVLTFSEFGRTVAENGRHGTDHGNASLMFLAGGRLRGGIHGEHPSLTDLDGDAPKHHTDFRAVYATVLADWLALPAASILGAEFPHLALLSLA